MTDRFVSPCSLPTPAEREILQTLIEEASEVIQRVTKMLRFGVTEIQPGQPYTNAERLSLEIGDLYHMIDLANHYGMQDDDFVEMGRDRKRDRFEKYRQFRECPLTGATNEPRGLSAAEELCSEGVNPKVQE